jgi:hypothetical protein
MRIVLCIAVVLAAAAGVATAAARHGRPASAGPLELLAKAGKTVTVTGAAIGGLYPGASKPLVVTVKNLNAFTIKVAGVKAAVVAKTSTAGCPGSFLTATAAKKALTIAKKRSARATLTVTMKATAPDSCQGAKFTLKLSARAVKG